MPPVLFVIDLVFTALVSMVLGVEDFSRRSASFTSSSPPAISHHVISKARIGDSFASNTDSAFGIF